jgi:hypothetical protein
MKLHRNVRTTPLSRRQLVERVLTRQWTYYQPPWSRLLSAA